VKRTHEGRLDYVSPVPSPFNYGCVPGQLGADGDPIDAVLLGPWMPRGHREEVPVRAVVRLMDAGLPDDKLICSRRPLTRRDRWLVTAFFRLYGPTKGLLNRLRGHPGATGMTGLEVVG